MTTTATRPVTEEDSRERSRRTAAAAAASDALTAVKTVAQDAASRVPGVASMSRSALDDANRRIESSSDEMVRLGTALSFGFAVGLLVGGANRLLVGIALVPVGMLGMALLERAAKAASRRSDADESLADKAGNAGADLRRELGNR